LGIERTASTTVSRLVEEGQAALQDKGRVRKRKTQKIANGTLVGEQPRRGGPNPRKNILLRNRQGGRKNNEMPDLGGKNVRKGGRTGEKHPFSGRQRPAQRPDQFHWGFHEMVGFDKPMAKSRKGEWSTNQAQPEDKLNQRGEMPRRGNGSRAWKNGVRWKLAFNIGRGEEEVNT